MNANISKVELCDILAPWDDIFVLWKAAQNMTVFDGKYDYVAAGRFDRMYLSLDSRLKTPEYIEIAKLFSANAGRLISFYEFPLQLTFWSGVLGRVKMLGRYHVGIDPEDESHDGENKVQASIIDVYNRTTNNPNPERVLTVSSNAIGSLVGDNAGSGIAPAREGLEAAFAAMVMTAYTIFETLAVDLWIAAVNRHSSLGDNWAEKNKDKRITMEEMSGEGWNLSKSIGTFLHQTRRISLESLKDIRSVYAHTFKGHMDEIFGDCSDLVKAEKTRHLFAHRNGLIDRKFKDEMAEFNEYKSVAIGERLRLTGPVTGGHIYACLNCGTSLLLAADDWSLNNQ